MSEFQPNMAAQDFRLSSKPTFVAWLKHLFWFALTFASCAITGVFPLFFLDRLLPPIPDPENFTEALWLINSITPLYYHALQKAINLIWEYPELLQDGLVFAGCLLFILTCHEFGHYIACRLYKVEATLPFFLPSPPFIGIGTFGAFIRIKSPLPSRRAVFDIGVAGPLAGFAALIPVMWMGLAKMTPFPETGVAEITFVDQLLPRALGLLMGVDPAHSVGNPYYFAAWLGLLVTSLNLIPAGQLDGGHAIYAVFGERFHSWIGVIAFWFMLAASVLGYYLYNSPSGVLFVLLLGLMTRIGHPRPMDETPLDAKRIAVAMITLLVFILSFVPFPIQIADLR
jgi:membrane-associated protease RseP (regulator of RpoE activity)